MTNEPKEELVYLDDFFEFFNSNVINPNIITIIDEENEQS